MVDQGCHLRFTLDATTDPFSSSTSNKHYFTVAELTKSTDAWNEIMPNKV